MTIRRLRVIYRWLLANSGLRPTGLLLVSSIPVCNFSPLFLALVIHRGLTAGRGRLVVRQLAIEFENLVNRWHGVRVW